MTPLVVTRANIGNWSDSELAAMNVAIAQGKAECQARTAAAYTGADLIDLARLCALGQLWPKVIEPASLYLKQGDPRPLLADAYMLRIRAQLRLNQHQPAVTDTEALLKAVPYTPTVAACVDEVLGYLHFVYMPDALTLSALREPLVLAALTASATPGTPQTPQPSPEPLPPHQLYAEGLAFAALQQLAIRPAAADDTVKALDAALPATLSADEQIFVGQQRQRYALLGAPLTGIAPSATLQAPHTPLPSVPAHLTTTALLLFPDWCAQCVRMALQFPETVFKVEGHSAYLYGLLAETVPPRPPDPTAPRPAFNPAYTSAWLQGTPTLVVRPDLLTRFGGADYPLLLLTDANGRLRVLEPVSADEVKPGGTVDAAIAVVGRNFPALAPPAANTPRLPSNSVH